MSSHFTAWLDKLLTTTALRERSVPTTNTRWRALVVRVRRCSKRSTSTTIIGCRHCDTNASWRSSTRGIHVTVRVDNSQGLPVASRVVLQVIHRLFGLKPNFQSTSVTSILNHCLFDSHRRTAPIMALTTDDTLDPTGTGGSENVSESHPVNVDVTEVAISNAYASNLESFLRFPMAIPALLLSSHKSDSQPPLCCSQSLLQCRALATLTSTNRQLYTHR